MDFDVKFIIILQKGTVNDVEKVLLVVCPVFLRQFPGHTLQLPGKVPAAHVVIAFQHGLHGIQVAFLQPPQPGGAGVLAGPGVGNIEHIAQPGPVAGIVHQGDAFGAAPHIAPHFLIP